MERTKHFITTLNHIIDRPAMYSVNRVEDIALIWLGYSLSIPKEDAVEFIDFQSNFRLYVKKLFRSKIDYHWSRLIRLNAGSDIDSIDSFKRIFNSFLRYNNENYSLS